MEGGARRGVEKLIAVDVMVVVAEKSKEERKPKGVGKEGLGGFESCSTCLQVVWV